MTSRRSLGVHADQESRAGDKFTITVDRAPDGKIKVTSLSWEEAIIRETCHAYEVARILPPSNRSSPMVSF
jgi:hypothetical protein